MGSSSSSLLSSSTTNIVSGVIVRIRFMIISRIIINITNYNPVFLVLILTTKILVVVAVAFSPNQNIDKNITLKTTHKLTWNKLVQIL